MNSHVTPKTGEELLEQTLRFQDMIHRYICMLVTTCIRCYMLLLRYQSLKYGIIPGRNPSVKSTTSQQKRTEHINQLKALYLRETGLLALTMP